MKGCAGMNEGENRRKGGKGRNGQALIRGWMGLGPTDDLERGWKKGSRTRVLLIMGCALGNPSCLCLNCDEDGNWERSKRAFVTCNVKDSDFCHFISDDVRLRVSQWEALSPSPNQSRGPPTLKF